MSEAPSIADWDKKLTELFHEVSGIEPDSPEYEVDLINKLTTDIDAKKQEENFKKLDEAAQAGVIEFIEKMNEESRWSRREDIAAEIYMMIAWTPTFAGLLRRRLNAEKIYLEAMRDFSEEKENELMGNIFSGAAAAEDYAEFGLQMADNIRTKMGEIDEKTEVMLAEIIDTYKRTSQALQYHKRLKDIAEGLEISIPKNAPGAVF